jgi:hypothetical protein
MKPEGNTGGTQKREIKDNVEEESGSETELGETKRCIRRGKWRFCDRRVSREDRVSN